jgi:hypothetical protein
MNPSPSLFVLLAALLFAHAPAFSAELYKWVDEKGVTNYSNEPPPKGVNAKVIVPDDRVSVYTPDEATKQSIERSKERLARPPQLVPGPPPVIFAPDPRYLPPPPPPPGFYEPGSAPDMRR